MPGQKIKGGVADKYSVEDLAKMHGVTVDDIQKELTAGIEVEMEHTNSESKAREIAMDHISEHPKYYTDPEYGLISNEKKLREQIRRILNESASDDVMLGA
jgi:beta-glucosidase-like glycosyl hydrolase